MILGLLWTAFCVWVIVFWWKRWGKRMFTDSPPPVEEEPKGKGGVKLLERFIPKPPPEPTEADRMFERGQKTPPKSPMKLSGKKFRAMALEIKAKPEEWSATVPTVGPNCYLCQSERVPSAGILICRHCDGYTKELIFA